MNINSANPDETLTINITHNTEDVYTMVKDFVKDYNDIMKMLSDEYNAEKSDYEPLTEEEEAAMSDKQIEKWEEKAKSSILRRDDNLNKIMSIMRSASMALSEIGIETGVWTERGQLHINGDKDDATVSSKPNKLEELLQTDPDKVMNVLATAANDLYAKLGDKMKTSDYNTTQTIYSDKLMKKRIERQEEEIKKLEKAMIAAEDKYYKQFTAMEKAMARSQSIAASLGFYGFNNGA